MAYPSVTYTFSNGATADANQVNQNFTDIINGLSDGTKDVNLVNGTFAGRLTISSGTAASNSISLIAGVFTICGHTVGGGSLATNGGTNVLSWTSALLTGAVPLSITNATDTTSGSTGAIYTAGGIGATKGIYSGYHLQLGTGGAAGAGKITRTGTTWQLGGTAATVTDAGAFSGTQFTATGGAAGAGVFAQIANVTTVCGGSSGGALATSAGTAVVSWTASAVTVTQATTVNAKFKAFDSATTLPSTSIGDSAGRHWVGGDSPQFIVYNNATQSAGNLSQLKLAVSTHATLANTASYAVVRSKLDSSSALGAGLEIVTTTATNAEVTAASITSAGAWTVGAVPAAPTTVDHFAYGRSFTMHSNGQADPQIALQYGGTTYAYFEYDHGNGYSFGVDSLVLRIRGNGGSELTAGACTPAGAWTFPGGMTTGKDYPVGFNAYYSGGFKYAASGYAATLYQSSATGTIYLRGTTSAGVNAGDAATMTDFATCTKEGAWTLGGQLGANYNGQVHKVSGQLAVATPSSPDGDESGFFLISSNLKFGSSGNRYSTTLGGGGIFLDTRPSSTGYAVSFYANNPGDALGNESDYAGGFSHAGNWTLAGYTQLGSDAPALKVKAIAGVYATGGLEHGLSAARIKHVLVSNNNGGNDSVHTGFYYANVIQSTGKIKIYTVSTGVELAAGITVNLYAIYEAS